MSGITSYEATREMVGHLFSFMASRPDPDEAASAKIIRGMSAAGLAAHPDRRSLDVVASGMSRSSRHSIHAKSRGEA